MIVTVCHEIGMSLRLHSDVLYGVSTAGVTERQSGDTQRL
jgi:hypothetical protein